MSDPVIHLRWMRCDRLSAPELAVLATTLDAAETARAARFHFDADRRAYIGAHGLARQMLARFGGGRPADWRFEIAPGGKPRPLTAPGASPLWCNLSHSRSLVMVALSGSGEVGVDVERAGRDATLAEVSRMFAPEEIAAIDGAPDPARMALIHWVLKEAYAKAKGIGLGAPLDSYAVAADPPRLLRDDQEAAPGPWSWHLFSPDGTSQAAVVAATPRARFEIAEVDGVNSC